MVNAMGKQLIPAGYKQTEVGVIPILWNIKKITEIGSVASGGTPNRENKNYWGGNIPWVTTSLIDGEVISNAYEFITEEGLKNSATKWFSKNTILIAMYGQGKTRGKVGILGIDATINQACAGINLYGDVHVHFLFHYLKSQYHSIRELSNSGGQENLSGAIIKSIYIPIPTKQEQTAIANALSDVDALIAALEKLINKKSAIKTAAMQQLLTGKKRLPPFDQLNTGYKQTELGEIPGDWEVMPIHEIAMLGNVRTNPKVSGGGVFCIELEHIEQGTGTLTGNTITTPLSSLKNNFVEGDILFGKLRSYLRKYWMADRDGVCSTEIWVLTANKEKTTAEFLYHTIRTESFIECTTEAYGTHMPRSDWKIVKEFLISVPTIAEQTIIGSTLSEMDKEIEVLRQRLHKTQQIKQGMMQELLTGKTRLVKLQGEPNA